MGKKGIFEDEDLFDLTMDCLRYYPKDRLNKESLIDHKFFHPTENHEPYPLIRLHDYILHQAVSGSTQSKRSNRIFVNLSKILGCYAIVPFIKSIKHLFGKFFCTNWG